MLGTTFGLGSVHKNEIRQRSSMYECMCMSFIYSVATMNGTSFSRSVKAVKNWEQGAIELVGSGGGWMIFHFSIIKSI